MNALVVADGLVKRFPKRGQREPLTAVDGVNFSVERGQIVGLLGPNGAGKTTTIKMLCGLVTPDEGAAKIAGFDLRRNRAACLRRIAAVLEGNRNLYWRLTARENLHYFAGNRGLGGPKVRLEADDLLERFGLADKADQLVSALSRGMQQKLAIAVAMLAGSEVILLDEPTLGLDVEAGYDVRRLLREISDAGRTVMISTHDMPVVQELCDRAVIIASGRVVADERVDALLRLFGARAYSVDLAEPLAQRQQDELAAAFPHVRLEEGGHGFTVDLESGDAIYRLMNALERVGAKIEGLDRTSVDFEQVFRRLVGGERPGAPTPVPTAPLPVTAAPTGGAAHAR